MQRLLTIVALGALATVAMAGPREDVIDELGRAGYDTIRIQRTWLGRTRFVATGPSGTREVVLNPSTGEILRDHALPAEVARGQQSPVAPLAAPSSGTQPAIPARNAADNGASGRSAAGGNRDDTPDGGRSSASDSGGSGAGGAGGSGNAGGAGGSGNAGGAGGSGKSSGNGRSGGSGSSDGNDNTGKGGGRPDSPGKSGGAGKSADNPGKGKGRDK